MDAPASFGSWLKLRRWTLDLTQDALARQVGCSVVTIRKLESDDRRPSRQIAARLADALHVAQHERALFMGLARAEPAPAAPKLQQEVAPQASRVNLPLPLTRLIGRKGEIATIRRALLRSTTRLLTLAGAPGVGKTRLALHVAAELRQAFADGVCFVDLAPIRDPDLLLVAIAQALGLQQIDNRPLLESMQDYLHGKRLLLLLDNFEQVVEAAPLVVGLLAGNIGLKTLVTSRIPLHVRGEQVVVVAPLPIPHATERIAVRSLRHNPAVALFAERSQAVQQDFALTETNVALVSALCARLDGLPLAIELVASRVATLPLATLLAGLERRLALLTNGPRDLPLRHQALRTAIAGSYDLLDPPAQALFRRLSVFVGDASREAIAAVNTGIETQPGTAAIELLPPDPSSLPAILATLVMHSLLVQPAHTEDGPRWGMLETIREFAWERLVEQNEATPAQHSHALYFLELAERAEPELHGPNQVTWLDRLEADNPNLRVALDYALQTGSREWALRLGVALRWFWFVRGNRSEGRRWLDRMLDAESASPLVQATSQPNLLQQQSTHARALHGAGHLALSQGDFGVARARLEASVRVWRELTDQSAGEQYPRRGLFAALTFLVLTLQFVGDTSASEPLVAEILSLHEALDDPHSQATFLYNWGGYLLRQKGDYVQAGATLKRSLALFRELGDLWHSTRAVIDLGLVAMYQEDYTAAHAWYTEGLTLAQVLKDRELIAWALSNLGDVARCQDDDARAARLYVESLQLHQEMGNKPEIPRLVHNLGFVSLHQGDTAQAISYFRDALALFRQLGMNRGVAESLAGLAAVAARCGEHGDAARLWGAAQALHTAGGTKAWPADRREHLRYQAVARAKLNGVDWEAGWQDGESNPLAQQALLDELIEDWVLST